MSLKKSLESVVSPYSKQASGSSGNYNSYRVICEKYFLVTPYA